MQGVKILNLRLENILIDTNLNVRLCGFSYASLKETGKYHRQNVYSAPEILALKACDGIKTDIFALGVVLFMLVLGVPPFRRASFMDSHYKRLQNSRTAFWSLFPRVSEEFKELVQGMLKDNPNDRYDINAIKLARWIKCEITHEEIQSIEIKLLNSN